MSDGDLGKYVGDSDYAQWMSWNDLEAVAGRLLAERDAGHEAARAFAELVRECAEQFTQGYARNAPEFVGRKAEKLLKRYPGYDC